MKAAFVAKILSEVLDFGASYEILQFNFDRFVMHDVHAKLTVAANRDRDGHCFFDSRHWAPGHWRRHHALLLDIVAQLGAPDLFLTISPWEWSFPFPYWIQRAHALLNRGPTDLPGPDFKLKDRNSEKLFNCIVSKKQNDSSFFKKHI